jgi:hypothetical protein
MKVVYSYKHVPTLKAFSQDDTFLRGAVGPYGSGKSSACVIHLIERAMKQNPGSDGVRRTRWAVVRNTYPQLRDTTIKTFMDWLPYDQFGHYVSSTHDYTIDTLQAPDGSPVMIEVLFRALDKPEHVRNLLSLELTGAWFNEVREIARPIFDHMTGRVNRYPAMKDGGPTWAGIFCDTNPCDTDHWFYKLFEEDKPWICAKPNCSGEFIFDERNENGHCLRCGCDKGIPYTKVFHQPSGRGPMAENLPNLAPDYYAKLMLGKTPEFIKVYVDGEYGFVADGRAVYTNWSSFLHQAKEIIPVVRGLPLIIGLDFGRNPAAVFCQGLPRGHFNVLDEMCAENMDLREFIVRHLKPYLQSKYFGMDVCITGDPSGITRAQTDSNTCFKELRAQHLPGTPAPSNSLQARLGAVNTLLTKMIPVQKKTETDLPWIPALQVSPNCKVLLRGFNGAYRMRRLMVVGEERYKSEPEKTKESHPHDALQYAALTYEAGAVRVRTSIHGGRSGGRTVAPPMGAYT